MRVDQGQGKQQDSAQQGQQEAQEEKEGTELSALSW
jgi:hypothetical protein